MSNETNIKREDAIKTAKEFFIPAKLESYIEPFVDEAKSPLMAHTALTHEISGDVTIRVLKAISKSESPEIATAILDSAGYLVAAATHKIHPTKTSETFETGNAFLQELALNAKNLEEVEAVIAKGKEILTRVKELGELDSEFEFSCKKPSQLLEPSTAGTEPNPASEQKSVG